MQEPTKLRVAFIVVSLESGGTENYLLRFLEYFIEQNPSSQVTILTKGGKAGSLFKNFQDLNVSIEILKLGYFNLINIARFKRKLMGYDVVCDLTGNFAGIIMLLAKLSKVPKRIAFYRASSNHFKPNFFRNNYNHLMRYFVLKYATHILSNSKAAFDFFYPSVFNNDKRFKVIKNGVYTDRFLKTQNKLELRNKYGLPGNAVLIGHVGRLNRSKNFETIFEVIKEIKSLKNYKDIYFVFCGRETNSIIFQRKLKEHGILDACYCLGQRERVYEILQCYDLFYFPSITEGQPNALIEAMISGLPFVASNIDAIKESVPVEAYDQLVDPLDAKAASNKIIQILNSDNNLGFQKWAIYEYDAVKRFEEFTRIILK